MCEEMNVLVFGELLLRLDTPGHERFVQTSSLDVSFTGGEANVSVALSQWGVNTSVASCVPSNEIGDACVNHLRRYGVNTDSVIRSGERLGLLFVETGAGRRIHSPGIAVGNNNTIEAPLIQLGEQLSWVLRYLTTIRG